MKYYIRNEVAEQPSCPFYRTALTLYYNRSETPFFAPLRRANCGRIN